MSGYNPIDPSHNMAYIITSWRDPIWKLLSQNEKDLMMIGTMPQLAFKDGTVRFITVDQDALANKTRS